MESYKVLKEAIDEVGVKKVAAEIKVSTSLVYKWCQPQPDDELETSGARNPLDRLYGLWEATQHPGMVEWLCSRTGGFYVPNPIVKMEHINTVCLEETQQMISEFSQLLQEISKSLADDGEIDDEEAARIRKKWQKLKGDGEQFVHACEQGLFVRSD